jgi:hypothetical protein
MSLSDLASLGSFVSGAAVLISLIYLALQIKQAERYQRAIAQQARADRLVDSWFRLADSEMREVMHKGQFGEDDISLTQVRQFEAIFRAIMYGAEDSFRQHKGGLISDDVFDGYRSSLKNGCAGPGWRAIGKSGPQNR